MNQIMEEYFRKEAQKRFEYILEEVARNLYFWLDRINGRAHIPEETGKEIRISDLKCINFTGPNSRISNSWLSETEL